VPAEPGADLAPEPPEARLTVSLPGGTAETRGLAGAAMALDALPVLRPPVAVLAGGVGWAGRRLQARVTCVPDLASAVGLVTRAIGG
jgi:hypothetical protein